MPLLDPASYLSSTLLAFCPAWEVGLNDNRIFVTLKVCPCIFVLGIALALFLGIEWRLSHLCFGGFLGLISVSFSCSDYGPVHGFYRGQLLGVFCGFARGKPVNTVLSAHTTRN